MADRYLTPPALARQYGVNSDKVLAWIESGELSAVNVASRVGGRPRWRISAEAIAEFEARRAAKPPVKRRKRKRQTAVLDIIQ